ncbi:hypothetical protein JCM15579A_27980 [Marinifilum fragile]
MNGHEISWGMLKKGVPCITWRVLPYVIGKIGHAMAYSIYPFALSFYFSCNAMNGHEISWGMVKKGVPCITWRVLSFVIGKIGHEISCPYGMVIYCLNDVS